MARVAVHVTRFDLSSRYWLDGECVFHRGRPRGSRVSPSGWGRPLRRYKIHNPSGLTHNTALGSVFMWWSESSFGADVVMKRCFIRSVSSWRFSVKVFTGLELEREMLLWLSKCWCSNWLQFYNKSVFISDPECKWMCNKWELALNLLLVIYNIPECIPCILGFNPIWSFYLLP